MTWFPPTLPKSFSEAGLCALQHLRPRGGASAHVDRQVGAEWNAARKEMLRLTTAALAPDDLLIGDASCTSRPLDDCYLLDGTLSGAGPLPECEPTKFVGSQNLWTGNHHCEVRLHQGVRCSCWGKSSFDLRRREVLYIYRRSISVL